MAGIDRVQERRRATALARHCRDQDGLPNAEIARRLGRAQATIKAYLWTRSAKSRARSRRATGASAGAAARRPCKPEAPSAADAGLYLAEQAPATVDGGSAVGVRDVHVTSPRRRLRSGPGRCCARRDASRTAAGASRRRRGRIALARLPEPSVRAERPTEGTLTAACAHLRQARPRPPLTSEPYPRSGGSAGSSMVIGWAARRLPVCTKSAAGCDRVGRRCSPNHL
jgi:hypothetical protein